MIYTWHSTKNDQKFAKFLSSMRSNTLQTLQTISDIEAGAETFLALNNHGKSLEDLRLCISNDSIPHLALLQGCTALKTLRVEDIHGTTDLEAIENDVFRETIAWLQKCSNLQRLSFSKLQSGAAITGLTNHTGCLQCNIPAAALFADCLACEEVSVELQAKRATVRSWQVDHCGCCIRHLWH